MIYKILLGFLLIALAETLNGILRVRVLHKKLGVKKAKVASFLLGCLIIFLLNISLVPWINPKNMGEAFLIGVLWMALLMAYDICVGKILFKFSWQKIIEDFNIFKGNLLGFGMVFVLVLPMGIYLFGR